MAELITQIRDALKKAGLDVALAESIKVTDESQIAAEIVKLTAKKELSPEQFAEELKKAGLDENYKKFLQSETDKRVTQALATHDLKITKEKEEAEAKRIADEEKNKKQATMSDTEKTIANLSELIGNLNKKIDGLSETTVKTKRETLIKDALKKADLGEGFATYINVEKDEEIEESVKNLKDQVLGIKQAEIDKKLKEEGGAPNKGEGVGSVGDTEAEEFAKERNEGSKGEPFQGFDEKEIVEGK